MEFIIQPQNDENVGHLILKILDDEYGKFSIMNIAVAFAKSSGLNHLAESIRTFAEKGRFVKIIVGIDHEGTSIEALEILLSLSSTNIQVWINHVTEGFVTFHPKMYLFENDSKAMAIIGSNNLTQGGLFTNDEVSISVEFDLETGKDRENLNKLKSSCNYWSDEHSGNCMLLTGDVLSRLIEGNYILSERVLIAKNVAKNGHQSTTQDLPNLFRKSKINRKAPKKFANITSHESTVADTTLAYGPNQMGFVMTLQKTDVGSGQTTPGTSRRSPEIFIPLSARDAFPEFWGWMDSFSQDQSKPGKYDRLNVRMRIGGNIANVNMMTWPDKHDFRLRSEVLRKAGNIGDILRIEQPPMSTDYDYYVEIIPAGTTDYDTYLSLCDQITRNSTRRWGYYRS